MQQLTIALLAAIAAPAQTAPPPVAPAPAAATSDNAEMARLFAADQDARKNIDPARFRDRAFVERMIAADAERRTRTRALLDAGRLTTGADYYAAAFVFQHGDHPDDYLLAHSLALAAVARGKPDASWIAAATLDRYLQTIWQRQIYGTQFATRPGLTTTQEPYDRALIPDSLRTALGVPVLAKQQERLAEMQAANRPAK